MATSAPTYPDLRQQVLDIIQEATQNQRVIVYPFAFAQLLNGDQAASILLNQILYWSSRAPERGGWFYKTYDQWAEEAHLSRYQITRALHGDPRVHQPRHAPLTEMGVQTQVRKVNGTPITHYRIDMAVFVPCLTAFLAQHTHEALTLPKAAAVPAQPAKPTRNNVTLPSVTSPQVEVQHCSTSSLYIDDSSQIPSIESHSPQPAAPHTEETDLTADERLTIVHFEKSFGVLWKNRQKPMKDYIMALGLATVRDVLARCATAQGKSWNYAFAALRNECERQTALTAVSPAAGAGLPPLTEDVVLDDAALDAEVDAIFAEYTRYSAQAPVVPTARVQTQVAPGNQHWQPLTALDVFKAADLTFCHHLPPGQWQALSAGMGLGDYDPDTHTYTFVMGERKDPRVLLSLMSELTMSRLIRHLCPQKDATVCVVSYADWHAQDASAQIG